MYASVDKLQNILATEVFAYAKDKKKASGRALGTLVEIVTFYTLCAWGLRDRIAPAASGIFLAPKSMTNSGLRSSPSVSNPVAFR